MNRDLLRAEVLAALDNRNERQALILLLGDQDDFARTEPPTPSECGDLVDGVQSGQCTLRAAMAALKFGPVADYFAFRWSSPTYLSGLALLDRFGGGSEAGPVVEVACGIGHFLRDLDRRGRQTVGVDVVFSKLWLARQFVVGDQTPLICGDVAAGWPLGAMRRGAVGFCHDAFYFLPGKDRVLAAFQACVGKRGRLLIGHAHNRNSDHGGVAGEPRTPAEYAALLPDGVLFDDAELARSAWAGTAAPPRRVDELDAVEALALVWIGPEAESGTVESSLLEPISGAALRLNPLLCDHAGHLEPAWPSTRFAAEYAAASDYLVGEPVPTPALLEAARQGIVGTDSEVRRLARRRILLDLPRRW